MSKRYPVEQRERAMRMVLDRLGEYRSVCAASQAMGPKLGVGPETLRKWMLQAQVDAEHRPVSDSAELQHIRRLRGRDPRSEGSQRDLEGRFDFLREGTRPSPPLICAFIDARCGPGLRGRVDLPGPAPSRAWRSPRRTYRDWKNGRAVGARSDRRRAHRCPRATVGTPESIYGRRKMTAYLRRQGHQVAAWHTVDRLMGDEGLSGVVRGRKHRTTVLVERIRVGHRICSTATSPRPCRIANGSPTSPTAGPGRGSSTWPS